VPGKRGLECRDSQLRCTTSQIEAGALVKRSFAYLEENVDSEYVYESYAVRCALYIWRNRGSLTIAIAALYLMVAISFR
jgi:hypothetical protein